MAEGFLGRWSQRKQAVRDGRLPPQAPAVDVAPVVFPVDSSAEAESGLIAPAVNSPDSRTDLAAQKEAPPAPTMADVEALNPDSSYAPFVARDVAPEVRNAAMKKLFSDPHYRVMDGLDIYIDDYAKPSPLPASMLAKMASAQFLNLVDPPEPDSSDKTRQASQCDPLAPALNDPHHDHTDLRLQPDHAAAIPQPGRDTS